MVEQLVTKEAFELAKTKGFRYENCNCGGYPDCICTDKRVTQSFLQTWLRNEMLYDIEINRYYYDGKKSNFTVLVSLLNPLTGAAYYIFDYHSDVAEKTDVRLTSYEEALDIGILKALNTLKDV